MTKNKEIENLDIIIKTLPQKPGVYQFFDKNNTIIYIGKAKNLKRRVSSYFQKEHVSAKLRILVRRIAKLEYIVVDTEIDALLLENNLIKKYQPRYNILLKDDKSFPWICVKNEHFPRIFPTRNLVKDKSQYFGPYASIKMMNSLLEMIHELFPIRTCKLNLSPEAIARGKYRVCLEYHIKRCLGPCENRQSEEDYLANIEQIKNILKVNIGMVISELKKMMMDFAQNQEFEKAQIVKEKIQSLENYQSRSTVVNPNMGNIDVYSISSDEKFAYVNFLRVIDGAVVQTFTREIKKNLDETDEEILSIAMVDNMEKLEFKAKEIVLPILPEFRYDNIKYTVPQRGDKLHLLELSQKNVKFFMLDKQRRQSLVDPNRNAKRILEKLQEDLAMDKLPMHIECFDNSNIQGEYAVSAMVCFKNAKPSKKDYRHFNIKTVKGADDYATMKEVLQRRYKRLLEEKAKLPDLIVVDGGKGQLSVAYKVLQDLGIHQEINIIAIAEGLEEIYKPFDKLPLYIDKKSESLRLIQHLRDEAHRFGLSHHRVKRQKGIIKTELTEIKGIGDKLSEKLLQHFRSVERIKTAELQDLEDIIGRARAKVVYEHFRKKS